MTALLRPGAITKAQLEEVLGPLETGWTGTGAHPAPGLHEKHYSPKTKLILGPPPTVGKGIYLDKSKMPNSPEAYAAALYETLHQLDMQGWDWIAIEHPPTTPEWEAVNDRLRRAAVG
jgi:L-threonylcarbamoyladenylate synthase